MKPASQRFTAADGFRAANQDQKGRLKSVFGLLRVAEQTPADAEDHGAVPPHEKSEGVLIAVLHEPPEQLAIAQVAVPLEGADPVKITDNVRERGLGHDSAPWFPIAREHLLL